MKYTLLSSVKLKATLSPEDLSELGFSFTPEQYTGKAARQALIKLLERGKEETGFDPGCAKLYIELYPCDDGGIVVYFTCLAPGQTALTAGNKVPTPVIFAFDSADALTEGCAKTFAHCGHRIYKSSLYKLDDSYRLTVYPLDFADRLSILFLSEYGCIKGEGEILAAFVEEHGKLLIEDNALDVLAEHFG